jgi:hypothetical protein
MIGWRGWELIIVDCVMLWLRVAGEMFRFRYVVVVACKRFDQAPAIAFAIDREVEGATGCVDVQA